MNETISLQQLQSLRNEFKVYLQFSHPDWSEKTVAVHYSDAFFALNNNIGVDFWSSLVSEESILAVRGKICDYLACTKDASRADERSSGYLSSLRNLKAFLDDKHPTLAEDWSGKSISDTYLKTDFQNWMKRQKKSTGDLYSPNTINAYATALKNATTKLNLDDDVFADLFYYNSTAEFEEAHKKILAAPNFEDVDIAAGNKAYSNGMVLYGRFLKELGEPSCWIFQGNPKYYDVVGAVKNCDYITWAVNQNQKQIKKDDRAYIWLSGSEGGVIAAGTITCNPEMREPNANDEYSRESLKTEPFLAVDIDVEREFTDTLVKRSVLLADERTKQLGVLTYPGATNFRVTKAQEEVIESTISGDYERVPAVNSTTAPIVDNRKYWLYSPGENARLWDECYQEKIMVVGWDELGDLSQFENKDDVKNALKHFRGEESSHKNAVHALWQFNHEVKPGDVVFAKRGMNMVIGRGIVESSYMFDDTRIEYKHVCKMQWTHNGEWPHPGQAAMKTLTDISSYTEYVQKLELLFAEDQVETPEDIEIIYPEYTGQDFLSEVFMNAERYNVLKGLLKRKKNIILQGAPGVGKTFAAQRLAFSIMGEKDISRVKVVQFHQSYSYEDFVMGYRPDGSSFKLARGPFYEFCKEAETDDKDYFFIIDEINRGNLSKIFGELLMLIENDRRGETNSIRLLYANEQFSVPANVHIIGMMNTADRSLAMIDYALRRRFAFFEMAPAFSTEGFKSYETTIQNPKFDALISTIEALNKTITEDAALGSGFRIGHSYFCTTDVVDDAWLSDVVEFEIIPLLSEYWFDEPTKVEQWSLRLRGANRG